MISLSSVSKSFGERTLFEHVTLQLDPAERYGLVGANGSGKTTLLQVLAGQVDVTDGTVSSPRDLRVGILRQDSFLYDEKPVLAVALMGNQELSSAIVEKEALLAKPREEFDPARFSELEETVQRHDGYTVEARAAAILEGLGLPERVHQQPLATLSGGFKLRVLLAQVLSSSPDVLLLDEPTNHLDILSIRWLEKFLRDFDGPVVVVSHDHRFLDNVCTYILDVDYQTVLRYPGNYTAFTVAKREERDRREKDIASRERDIARHQKFVDRFRAKASKARQAQSKLRLIEKRSDALDELPVSSRRHPSFLFEQVRPSGRDVLAVKGITKAFGDNEVLHGVDLEIRRGDRLSILGPNGIGKSTLLKIMMGTLKADAGSIEWGYETYPGYFAQDHEEQFDDFDQEAESWIWDACPNRDIGYVKGQMGRVLFSGEEGKKRLGRLSGGEAARLIFCRLAIQRPNVLVLDEPTNHLDLEAIESLVEGLRRFAGTLIFVSHDRWFVAKLATRILEITEQGVRDYGGTYQEFIHASGDDHLDVDTVVLKARKEKRHARKQSHRGGKSPGRPPPSGRDREREVRRLEAHLEELASRIGETETRIGDIDQMFSAPEYYRTAEADAVRGLEAERSGLEGELRTLMADWEQAGRDLERVADGAD